MTKRVEPREHVIDAELANGNRDAWKQALGFPTTTYKDPTCPKCGITLGNKMSYACSHSHCPVGLN